MSRAGRLRRWSVSAVIVGTLAVAMAIEMRVAAEPDARGSSRSSGLTVFGDGSLPDNRPRIRDARAPLSTEEYGYAVHRALRVVDRSGQTTNVTGGRGPEVLSVNLVTTKVDEPRRLVAVGLYDYSANRGHFVELDLTADRVIGRRDFSDTHPPLTFDEATEAARIAIRTDPGDLVNQFERIEGVPLVSLTQVRFVAGTWRYDGTTAFGAECKVDRCAELIIATPSGVYLDASGFVVDLSTGTVIHLRGRGR